jgi:hypothetical protein
MGSNSGDQKVNFGLQNALNRTYAHLQFKKFFLGLYPGPSLERGRKGRRGKEGRGWERREGRARKYRGEGGEGGVWTRGEGKGRGGERHAQVRPLSQILDTPLSS